ncbi:MAG TPA: hypothetical protein DEA55_08200 [Rhodospirillaceae bacterium]|nr:hypothetical protein [Rhodospirillaceae bacterium]
MSTKKTEGSQVKGDWKYVMSVSQALLPTLQLAWEKSGKTKLYRTCYPKGVGMAKAASLVDRGEVGIEKFVPTPPEQ